MMLAFWFFCGLGVLILAWGFFVLAFCQGDWMRPHR